MKVEVGASRERLLGFTSGALPAEPEVDEVSSGEQCSAGGDSPRLPSLPDRPELGQSKQTCPDGKHGEAALAPVASPIAGSKAQGSRQDRGGEQQHLCGLVEEPADGQTGRNTDQQRSEDAVQSAGERQRHSGAIDCRPNPTIPIPQLHMSWQHYPSKILQEDDN